MQERYLVDGKIMTIYSVQSPNGKHTYFKGYYNENGKRVNHYFGKVDPRPNLQRMPREWKHAPAQSATPRYRVMAYTRTLEQLHEMTEYHDLPMVKVLAKVVSEAYKKLPKEGNQQAS